MSPKAAYDRMREELGLKTKSGYNDSGVGKGKDPWRSYESGITNNPYAYLEDGPNVGVGKDFTKKQKETMLAENRKRNSGAVKSDNANDYYVMKQVKHLLHMELERSMYFLNEKEIFIIT